MNIIANVVVMQDNKVLLVQENWGHVKGMWNFPAGHVDEGENIFDAAIREAKEETGYDVKLTGFIGVQNAVYNDRQVIHINFLAEITGGEVSFDENEISEVKFLRVNEMLELPEEKLRCKELRIEILQKILDNKIYPLNVVSNYNYKE